VALGLRFGEAEILRLRLTVRDIDLPLAAGRLGLFSLRSTRLLRLCLAGLLLDDDEEEDDEIAGSRFLDMTFPFLLREDEMEELATDRLLFVLRLTGLLEPVLDDEYELIEESEADEDTEGDLFRLLAELSFFFSTFTPSFSLSAARFASIESAVPVLERKISSVDVRHTLSMNYSLPELVWQPNTLRLLSQFLE
jgi:hypothetical protein